MKIFRSITAATIFAVIVSVLLVMLSFHSLYAASDLSIKAGVDAARGSGQPANLFGSNSVFTAITNTLLFIIGALSVVMIIIGGLRYVISGGNSASITGAKNTILYALVGLIVAFLAYAIINFILGSLAIGGASGTNI